MTTTITVIYWLRNGAMCKEKEKTAMLLPVLKILERGKSYRECFDMWETRKIEKRCEKKNKIKYILYLLNL